MGYSASESIVTVKLGDVVNNNAGGQSKEAVTKALGSQLEFLDKRMAETAQTANQFLGKFLFGGLVAVVALLNADLVILGDRIALTRDNAIVLGSISTVVLAISWLYFSTVVRHYRRFTVSHRKLKYKYELTMHALLSGGDGDEYATLLEEKVDVHPDSGFEDKYPARSDFTTVGRYFLNHHRSVWSKNHSASSPAHEDTYFWIAMLLVVLTLVVRLLALVLTRSVGAAIGA